MPGMLTRTFDEAEGSGPSQGSDKENHATGSNTLKRPFEQVDGTSDDRTIRNDEPPAKRQMTNGDTTSNTNGTITNGNHYLAVPQVQQRVPQIRAAVEVPPPLYHVQDNVVPLSLIRERMAQEAHVELEELIADLSNLHTTHVNGYTHSRADVHQEKKNKIWDFAHKWRSKFIQLGVLTYWSENAEAVGRLIDLSFWLTGQRTNHREFVNWMGELKRQLSYDSLPAPDLRTALEIMSTGKAQWVSHLGYIPEKDLTPKELLKSLKTLNTILTIRLTTQQDIPYHFSKWTIRDGRVTFHVKDEFELDLAIASEDPTSQFWFIDLRFLFSPSSKTLSQGPTKSHLEWRINEILFRDGLQNCYEFLHELILEHKLTILRDQARKLIRGQWSDNTRLCASNRGIVIQYWTNKPGKKNWIEIAVSSGKSRGVSATALETSQLSLRWHRHGVDVLDHGIAIDYGHLSTERILKEVIACHTNHIFKETKRLLRQSPIFAKDRLSVKHRAHAFDSRDCSLKVQFSRQYTLTINQDAVTGMLNITPTSELSWTTMLHANTSPDPALHLANQLGILRCNTILADAVFEAKRFGWQAEPMEHLTQETKVRLFKSEKIRHQFFHIPSWPVDWFLLAFTTTLDGDDIWLIEMQDKKVRPSPEDFITGRYQRFKSSIRINIKEGGLQLLALNTQRLIDIEKHSVKLLSHLQDCRWLQQKTSDAENSSRQVSDARTGNSQLYIKYPITRTEQPNTKGLQTWSTNTIKISYVGSTISKGDLVTFVTGQLQKRNTEIKASMFRKGGGLLFNPIKSTFTFRIRTVLGDSTLEVTDAKLDRLGSLIRFLDVTQDFGFVCHELTLSRMSFTYSSINSEAIESLQPLTPSTNFAASISFPDSSQLRISFSQKNPHLLIQDFLNYELNRPNGMASVARLLCSTLPLVQTLRAIQELHCTAESRPKCSVMPRSCTSFQVRYSNKTVMLRYEILLRLQNDVQMHVTQAVAVLQPGATLPKKVEPASKTVVAQTDASESQQQQLLPEELQKIWETLVRARGIGWHNLGRGIICESSSIDTCLRHLDAVISEAFSKAADPGSELLPHLKMERATSNHNVTSLTSAQMDKASTVQFSNKSANPEDKTPSSPDTQASKATITKAAQMSQSISRPVTQQSGPTPPAATSSQGAPQANMNQARAGPGNVPTNIQNRGVNMNFKPGIGQQMPTANAISILQAQQRAALNFNAPQANMAQMRPGLGGQITGMAPQASMQANLQNKRSQISNPSPPKKANSGQSKNQPITLE